jgi:cyclopropane-fatty-acyl-phospholipid synthase
MASKSEVEVAYDVGNEFFRLWLDTRMVYSCGVFEGTDDLETAQTNKLKLISDFAHVAPGQVVLDMGCGWGANLAYLTQERGVAHAHGFTLSTQQHEEIKRRALGNVTASLVSYLDYQPPERVDAVTCIGMMEHIVRPAEARENKQIAIYRKCFSLAHKWSKPGAHFGLQSIFRNLIPRNGHDLRELAWMADTIYPGAMNPRLEDLVTAANPYWEVMQVVTRRTDYRRTCEHWRARLRDHAGEIVERWSQQLLDVYDRYLSACVLGFDKGYISLTQLSLRRID